MIVDSEMPEYVQGDAETDRTPQALTKRAITCTFSSHFFIAAKVNGDTC